MIRSVEINNLRGIRAGKLEGLTPLVVLVGPNGSGKSTVLDALMIGIEPRTTEAVARMARRRWEVEQSARWLFWKGAKQEAAVIKVTTASGKTRCAQLTLTEQGDNVRIQCAVEQPPTQLLESFVCFERSNGKCEPECEPGGQHAPPLEGTVDVRFVDLSENRPELPLDQLYTAAIEAGRRDEVYDIIKELLPTIKVLEILSPGGKPVLYLSFADRSVPAALAGDGIRLILRLALELAPRQGGLILLEEPEVHMHPGAIRQAAQVILAALHRQIQVILTTHSLELIDALIGACSARDLEQFSLYGLRLDEGILKSSRLAGPDVALARSTIEDDLR